MHGRISLTATLLALTLAATAHADVIVAGTGEPAFTNSATNTQWVQWTSATDYRIEARYSVDGVATKTDGPYDVAKTATTWVNWSGIAALAEGRTYGICVQGRWYDGAGMWFPDMQTSCASANGKRTATTIDRTKPAITLAAPAFVRERGAPITIGYEDNLAYPFGVAFVSVDSPQMHVLPGCAPEAATRVTTFRCAVALPDADGPHQVCAVVPDAAIPDNPSSSDQSGTANQANRSDAKCATVTLDRVAPAVTVAGPDELQVGHAGLFTAQASDATSGIAGPVAWNWGDGSSTPGYDASHAFANPGTYRLRLKVTDAVGNTAEATKDVKVTAAPLVVVKDPPAVVVPPAPVVTPAPSAPPVPAFSVRGASVRKQVLRATVTGATGTVRVTLRRGRAIVVSKRVTLKGGGLSLKLPRTLVAGKHVLEVRAGARIASTSVNVAGGKAGAKGSRLDPSGTRPKLP